MGELRTPPLATPIVAMLSGDTELFERARGPLEALLGPVGQESEFYPFEKTAYYNESMGLGLKRKFFAFRPLADSADLPAWKHGTNAVEKQIKNALPEAGRYDRPINLDVGYMTGAKLVLASTKDFAHRIYLYDCIFAEITLGFRGDSWVSHYFTFPDYKSGLYDTYLKKVRLWHLKKIKNEL